MIEFFAITFIVLLLLGEGPRAHKGKLNILVILFGNFFAFLTGLAQSNRNRLFAVFKFTFMFMLVHRLFNIIAGAGIILRAHLSSSLYKKREALGVGFPKLLS
jgi:hypothetical protein